MSWKSVQGPIPPVRRLEIKIVMIMTKLAVEKPEKVVISKKKARIIEKFGKKIVIRLPKLAKAAISAIKVIRFAVVCPTIHLIMDFRIIVIIAQSGSKINRNDNEYTYNLKSFQIVRDKRRDPKN